MVTGMSDRPIRAVLVGFGKTNQAVLELALTRPWLEVTGIVVRSAARDGEAANEPRRRRPGGPALLHRSRRHAAARPVPTSSWSRRPPGSPTSSRSSRRSRRPACRSCARPRTSPSSARAIRTRRRGSSDLAETHRIPIVATGANPGFVLDLWPLTLSGLAWDVEPCARDASSTSACSVRGSARRSGST